MIHFQLYPVTLQMYKIYYLLHIYKLKIFMSLINVIGKKITIK